MNRTALFLVNKELLESEGGLKNLGEMLKGFTVLYIVENSDVLEYHVWHPKLPYTPPEQMLPRIDCTITQVRHNKWSMTVNKKPFLKGIIKQ